MHKTLIGLLVAGGLLAAAPAQAIVFDSDWRIKGGLLSIENDNDPALNVGVIYAMDFVGIVGAEFEFNTTLRDGENAFSQDYSASQLGGYATLTSPGPIYFKAKAGYVYTDLDTGGASVSDTDASYGIGLGMFGFELEYTRTRFNGSDIDFLSLAFGF